MSGVAPADTGPLYALADPSDQFHDRAHRELGNIVSRNNSILVVFPVLCEAHTLVLRRLGGRYATVGLRKYSDHPITLIDALLARMTRRLEAPVWTFDRHV